jgi:hypothetical protein
MKMMKIWNCIEFLVLTCLEMFRPTPSWCSVVLSCCVNAPTSLHTGTTHGQYVDWSTDSRNTLPKWVFENGVYPGIPSGISIGGGYDKLVDLGWRWPVCSQSVHQWDASNQRDLQIMVPKVVLTSE